MTNGTKHTPGPWETEDREERILIWAHGNGEDEVACIDAATTPVNQETAAANACLIAAAPELLEALLGLVHCSHGEGVECAHYRRAHAAIAKATGR